MSVYVHCNKTIQLRKFSRFKIFSEFYSLRVMRRVVLNVEPDFSMQNATSVLRVEGTGWMWKWPHPQPDHSSVQLYTVPPGRKNFHRNVCVGVNNSTGWQQ
jgi:hypothetical protein